MLSICIERYSFHFLWNLIPCVNIWFEPIRATIHTLYVRHCCRIINFILFNLYNKLAPELFFYLKNWQTENPWCPEKVSGVPTVILGSKWYRLWQEISSIQVQCPGSCSTHLPTVPGPISLCRFLTAHFGRLQVSYRFFPPLMINWNKRLHLLFSLISLHNDKTRRLMTLKMLIFHDKEYIWAVYLIP